MKHLALGKHYRDPKIGILQYTGSGYDTERKEYTYSFYNLASRLECDMSEDKVRDFKEVEVVKYEIDHKNRHTKIEFRHV